MKKIWIVGAVLVLGACLAVAETNGRDPVLAKQLRQEMSLAKKDGAKGQLPQAWWDLDHRLDVAEDEGATAEAWQQMSVDAQRLRNAAAFVAGLRRQKSGMEALLGRFDQALREIAALSGTQVKPTLSGTPAATDLIERLSTTNLRRQVVVDSLTIANRKLAKSLAAATGQDSVLTRLRVEISALRQQLWEAELRAGVAEADRSAAESVLNTKQARDEAIASLRDSFDPAEGEIMLTPEGTIVMRVYGIAFAVGSAELSPDQAALLAKIVAAVQRFPGAAVRVEGHTDDTGSRQSNLRLSRRRAESVARALEKSLELPAETITTEGFGPDRPLALNNTPAGRALNRRIDVVLSGAL